ncbi:MAG: DsbC family protein [Azoarcus sp.]|jgi:thiol:disulfide interchange protein DsbC|nr:DsbC family protein [Azoarcus sp.]
MTSTTERRARCTPPLILALLAGGLLTAAHAGAPQPIPQAERLRAELEKTHPNTRFTEILPSPVSGLYEVWMDDNIAYVFAQDPRYFLFGHLFDTAQMTDLTASRLTQRIGMDAAPGPVGFDQLPFEDAIRTVHGNGKRRLAVFSDPACPYCRQIEAEFAGIGDITIHTFLVPFKGDALPVSIWCAADRAAAWRNLMLKDDRTLLAPNACPNPVARNLQTARKLSISGTPTLIWADGSRTEGFIGRAEIEARLDATTAVKGTPK